MHRVKCCRWRKMAESHQDKLPGRQTRQRIVPLTFQNIAILKHEALEVSQPCLHVSGGLAHVLCFVFADVGYGTFLCHPAPVFISHSQSITPCYRDASREKVRLDHYSLAYPRERNRAHSGIGKRPLQCLRISWVREIRLKRQILIVTRGEM